VRVALISDLHGNAVALRAVLADIARQGVDQVVCLGDVATLGPSPRATIEMLRETGCVCILGNHDEFLLDPTLIYSYSEQQKVIEAVEWCRSELGGEELAFVRGFESAREIDLDGGSTLLLYHGSPVSNVVDILATTDADELDELLAGRVATVMAGGHTHVQMLRQHRGSLLVNPGSVGLPFKEYVAGRPPTLLANAHYAIVDGIERRVGVELRCVPLDRAQLRKAAYVSDAPLRDELVQQYS
jgi:putative phosphoesterase